MCVCFETRQRTSVSVERSVSSCWMNYLATMTSYFTASNSWLMTNLIKVLLTVCLSVCLSLSLCSRFYTSLPQCSWYSCSDCNVLMLQCVQCADVAVCAVCWCYSVCSVLMLQCVQCDDVAVCAVWWCYSVCSVMMFQCVQCADVAVCAVCWCCSVCGVMMLQCVKCASIAVHAMCWCVVGYCRSVATGDHYKFVDMSVSRLCYIPAMFLMILFVSNTHLSLSLDYVS